MRGSLSAKLEDDGPSSLILEHAVHTAYEDVDPYAFNDPISLCRAV